jgi:hypothetical protein
MKNILTLTMTAIISVSINADTLKPFVSDGCSVFPDGTIEQNELWLSCCHQHDYDYWKGGTYQARLESDTALESCVAAVGEPEIALLMLVGIRVGGTPFLPTKFRWGYGWSYPRFYRELTESELKQVKNLTNVGS